MDIIKLLEECISDNFSEELNYQFLIDSIGKNPENQKKLCSYVLNKNLSHTETCSVLVILTELYNYQSEEQYILSFELLYDWLLNKMFSKELYEYSICYKFCRILTKISGDYFKVYGDIISSVKEDDPTTVQIAICSTYGLGKIFFQYEDLTISFINKISKSLQVNNSVQTIKDFKHFMLRPLKSFEYNLTDIEFYMNM